MRYFVSTFLLISCLIWATPALSGILVYDDCERNAADTGKWAQTLENGGSLRSTNEIKARGGNRSYRFESYRRAEINLKGPVSNLQWEKDYWLGYSFYLPNNYKLPTKWFGTLLQFHVRNEGCDQRPTTQALAFFRQGTVERPTVRALIAGERDQCTDNKFNYYKGFDSPVMKIGAWNDVVMRIRFSHRGNGANEIWMNGKKFVDQRNIVNCANDPSTGAPFLKLGTYTAEDKGNNTVVYFDEIRLGDSNSSYNEVAPKGAAPAADNNNQSPLPQDNLKAPVLSIVR